MRNSMKQHWQVLPEDRRTSEKAVMRKDTKAPRTSAKSHPKVGGIWTVRNLNLMIAGELCKHNFTKRFHRLCSFVSKITMHIWVCSLSELNKTYIHNLWPGWFKLQQMIPSCLILPREIFIRLFATLWQSSIINTSPIFQPLSPFAGFSATITSRNAKWPF